MLSDFTKSCGGDALEGQLWLLNAEHQQADGAGVNYSLRQLVGVLGDACQCPGSSLLDRGVELLEAVDESIKRPRVDNGLGKVRRVLGNRPQNVRGSLLVESLYYI